jgi:hypothetical protein
MKAGPIESGEVEQAPQALPKVAPSARILAANHADIALITHFAWEHVFPPRPMPG